MEEVKNINEDNIRPIGPSKIPIGRFRVESDNDPVLSMVNEVGESKGIDMNLNARSASPTPMSRIPLRDWRSKTTAYKKLMEKQECKQINYSSSYISKPNNRQELDVKEKCLSNYSQKSGKQSNIQNPGELMKPLKTFHGFSYARTSRPGSKKPSRLIKQRSRSEGPSRFS